MKKIGPHNWNESMLTAVIDLGWGDSGKAAIIDFIAHDYEYCVRYNGGANAGHTVVANGVSHKFHLVPAGVVQNKHCILAHGMAIDPVSLYKEQYGFFRSENDISDLSKPILYISQSAHCVMPWHIQADMKTSKKVGTTNKGIGPCYSDKALRRNAIRMKDLRSSIDDETLGRFFKIDEALQSKNVDWSLRDQYRTAASILEPYQCDTGKLLRRLVYEKRNILFESANGMMIDVDFGDYPYVTSSGVGVAAIPQACGLPNVMIDRVIGLVKVYSTRVGEGPFSTEYVGDKVELGNKIREIGHEYGTTTKRPRRIGALDLDVIKETSKTGGATELALMHVDVLNGFESVEYKLNGQTNQHPGWKDIKDSNLMKLVDIIEDETQLKVGIISYGADRTKKLLR